MNSTFGLKLEELLIRSGVSEQYLFVLKSLLIAFAICIIAYIAYFITNKILFRIIHRLVKKTKYTWDDIIFQEKVLKRLSQLAPAVVIYYFAKIGLADLPTISSVIQTGSYIYMILAGLFALDAFLNALHSAYLLLPVSKERPIKGYIQGIKIIVYALGTIFIMSTIIGKSPGKLLASLGAVAAILILVFKDTILGFVSSIQLSANQMVKPGDWITMPSKNADGTVLEININTVKVQNFDKTIVTIPTYALISESFQNWKGMEESKGRRIARSVYININSIKFCDKAMLEKFKKIKMIKDYINLKLNEIDQHNKKLELDENDNVSRRSLTNVGVFRKYMEIYLEKNPNIHGNEPPYLILVRHLQPTENGLPIQIYCFSKDNRWANYEQIQADVFDHILAVLPEFELSIFQNPSGDDFKRLAAIN